MPFYGLTAHLLLMLNNNQLYEYTNTIVKKKKKILTRANKLKAQVGNVLHSSENNYRKIFRGVELLVKYPSPTYIEPQEA